MLEEVQHKQLAVPLANALVRLRGHFVYPVLWECTKYIKNTFLVDQEQQYEIKCTLG